jgi:hypothetical protein
MAHPLARAVSGARFIPVVSIVDSDASGSCNLEFDGKKQFNR